MVIVEISERSKPYHPLDKNYCRLYAGGAKCALACALGVYIPVFRLFRWEVSQCVTISRLLR